MNCFSPEQPIGLDEAPVAIITVCPIYSAFLPTKTFSLPSSLTSRISSYTFSAPKCFACSAILSIRVGPDSPSRHPG
ncbi:hypothetical protein DSECCO2_537620 [anaerobic digester metagenome]